MFIPSPLIQRLVGDWSTQLVYVSLGNFRTSLFIHWNTKSCKGLKRNLGSIIGKTFWLSSLATWLKPVSSSQHLFLKSLALIPFLPPSRNSPFLGEAGNGTHCSFVLCSLSSIKKKKKNPLERVGWRLCFLLLKRGPRDSWQGSCSTRGREKWAERHSKLLSFQREKLVML